MNNKVMQVNLCKVMVQIEGAIVREQIALETGMPLKRATTPAQGPTVPLNSIKLYHIAHTQISVW